MNESGGHHRKLNRQQEQRIEEDMQDKEKVEFVYKVASQINQRLTIAFDRAAKNLGFKDRADFSVYLKKLPPKKRLIEADRLEDEVSNMYDISLEPTLSFIFKYFMSVCGEEDIVDFQMETNKLNKFIIAYNYIRDLRDSYRKDLSDYSARHGADYSNQNRKN